MSYYLAYGMNTNRQQMSWRCPKARNLGAVTLKDHKLAFKGCCDVIEEPDSAMKCVLWDITPECERALDLLEGYPVYYDKKQVKVKYKGRTINAMIYYMADKEKVDYPSDSYLTMVTEGYLQHNIGLEQVEQALKDVDDEYYCHFALLLLQLLLLVVVVFLVYVPADRLD